MKSCIPSKGMSHDILVSYNLKKLSQTSHEQQSGESESEREVQTSLAKTNSVSYAATRPVPFSGGVLKKNRNACHLEQFFSGL